MTGIARKLFLIYVLFLFTGCGPAEKRYSETKILMGTFVKVDVCSDYGDDVVQKAYSQMWNRLDNISDNMSIFNKNSDVSRINESMGDFVPLEKDLFNVIKESLYYSKLTGGAFDITVEPLISLWKKYAALKRMPSEKDVKSIKDYIGSDNILLSQKYGIKKLNKYVKINLGGIAKGYASDEAGRILEENGIKNFIVDSGGDIYLNGMNCKGKEWRVGIKDPKNRKNIISVVTLKRGAVTTSGDYEQFLEIQGKKESHILDPRTGYPQKGVISATVIAPSAIDADALSTSLCVMGAKDGIALIDKLGKNYAAFIITETQKGELIFIESKEYGHYRVE